MMMMIEIGNPQLCPILKWLEALCKCLFPSWSNHWVLMFVSCVCVLFYYLSITTWYSHTDASLSIGSNIHSGILHSQIVSINCEHRHRLVLVLTQTIGCFWHPRDGFVIHRPVTLEKKIYFWTHRGKFRVTGSLIPQLHGQKIKRVDCQQRSSSDTRDCIVFRGNKLPFAKVTFTGYIEKITWFVGCML